MLKSVFGGCVSDEVKGDQFSLFQVKLLVLQSFIDILLKFHNKLIQGCSAYSYYANSYRLANVRLFGIFHRTS